jgi:hypothetical protein
MRFGTASFERSATGTSAAGPRSQLVRERHPRPGRERGCLADVAVDAETRPDRATTPSTIALASLLRAVGSRDFVWERREPLPQPRDPGLLQRECRSRPLLVNRRGRALDGELAYGETWTRIGDTTISVLRPTLSNRADAPVNEGVSSRRRLDADVPYLRTFALRLGTQIDFSTQSRSLARRGRLPSPAAMPGYSPGACAHPSRVYSRAGV